MALWTMQSTAAAPANHAALYRRLPDDARLVEALGFDSMWFAEHRFWYDGWCPAPLVAAASAASATTSLGVGTSMVLLPPHDPRAMARAATTLDRLSGGRLQLGLGLGYRDVEFEAVGLRRRDRGTRMDVGLDLLLDQAPELASRLWVGGLADAAVARAARRGLSFLLPQTLRPDEVAAVVRRYRDQAEAAGRAPARVGVMRDTWVETDGEAARAFFLPRLQRHTAEEAGAWWAFRDGGVGFERPDLVERQLARVGETVTAGDPDEVAKDLTTMIETGVDLLIVRMHLDVTGERFGGALRLFATEVLPALRSP